MQIVLETDLVVSHSAGVKNNRTYTLAMVTPMAAMNHVFPSTKVLSTTNLAGKGNADSSTLDL